MLKWFKKTKSEKPKVRLLNTIELITELASFGYRVDHYIQYRVYNAEGVEVFNTRPEDFIYDGNQFLNTLKERQNEHPPLFSIGQSVGHKNDLFGVTKKSADGTIMNCYFNLRHFMYLIKFSEIVDINDKGAQVLETRLQWFSEGVLIRNITKNEVESIKHLID